MKAKVKKLCYVNLKRNGSLAEFIGIYLGDGNLCRHKRTENLRVICNSNDKKQIRHISNLIKKIFSKNPSTYKRKNENTAVISLYQCNISKRLNLPAGNKIKNKIGIPKWILSKKRNVINCLKGLFDTDGCFQKDAENYAQYIELKNNNERLRKEVYSELSKLGFSPQFGSNYVRLARKNEVFRFKKLINFRNYHCPVV